MQGSERADAGGAETARTSTRGHGRVTLAQVAERAGVSIATASKVLTGRARVSDAAREAVGDAVAELGYRRRPRHAEQRRRTLAIHLESVDSAYVMGVLAGAEEAARRAGAGLLLGSSGGSGMSRAWMAEMAARGAEGVLAVVTEIRPEHARWSRSLSLPVIAIDPILRGAEVPGILSVTATNWEGGAAAVRHLIGLGHRRIGILTGPPGSLPAQQRLEGYLSAVRAAGLEVDPALLVPGSFREEEGESGTEQLLALAEPPTAVFATSDGLAVGALRAARRRGIPVPEALSIVGFDDTMIAGWTSPQLTAIRQPLFSMGQVAVERLLALSSDPERFSHPFKLETQLIERESTAPAPAGKRFREG